MKIRKEALEGWRAYVRELLGEEEVSGSMRSMAFQTVRSA